MNDVPTSNKGCVYINCIKKLLFVKKQLSEILFAKQLSENPYPEGRATWWQRKDFVGNFDNIFCPLLFSRMHHK